MKTLTHSLNNTIKSIGLNPNRFPLVDKLIYVLHLYPAIIKDGHLISLGGPGIGKSTIISNSSSKSFLIPAFSSALMFGDLKKIK